MIGFVKKLATDGIFTQSKALDMGTGDIVRCDDPDISEAKLAEDGKTGKRRLGVPLHLRLSGMVSAREGTSTSSTHVL